MTESLRTRLFLLVAVGVSAAIVVVAFNPVPHSGGDNSGYLSLAHGLLTTGQYVDAFDPERLPHTKYPPVFPALLAAMMWLGARTWVAFKATAAVATVLAVGLTYLWAERRVGAVGSLAVALLLAAASAVVYYSHWVLSDPVFLALTVGALVALDRAGGERGVGWLALGVAAAWLAFFTRSAGLPLVLAILAWLALERRWRPLAATALAVGVPALAWWWRARGAGVASYVSELWMVDPYQPALGTIGPLGMAPRFFANLEAYVLTHGPGGLVGSTYPYLGTLGVVLTVAAALGWLTRARASVGPAELFLPMYAGLILLWPEVWAGDRFALPLYPLVLTYAGVALAEAGRVLPSLAATAVTAVAVAVLAVPSATGLVDGRTAAADCARLADDRGPFACYGPGVSAFAEAAEWTAGALPPGSVVMTRKPRHFYLLSGHPSRTFPFVEDPVAHLDLADRLGARYVLLDQWDRLAARYVGSAVAGMPGAYCYVGAFGDPRAGGAQLLAIKPPGERGGGGDTGAPGARSETRLEACPASYAPPVGDPAYSASSSSSGRVPLLSGLDS